jgi:hypothetical protein
MADWLWGDNDGNVNAYHTPSTLISNQPNAHTQNNNNNDNEAGSS